jgi:EmrB/QacA subfamily drug resistance transporter
VTIFSAVFRSHAVKNVTLANVPARLGEARSETAAREPHRPAGRKLVFAIVAMALMMGSIDQTIVATALPKLHTTLHAPINWAGWTITAYSLGTMVAGPVMGRISDQLGRKRVFISAVVVFTVASLLCGLSSSIYMLVPLRALQALGGGAFMPSATGIVSETFPENRDRAIGMFTSIFPLGAMIGPTVGGVILNYWSWRGIFFINVPIGALLLVLAIRYLPHFEPKGARRPDFAGAGYLAVVIVSLMVGISNFGSGHTKIYAPEVLLPEAIAALLVVQFVRHCNRVDSPVIPVRLLRERAFALMNFIAIVYGASAVGFAALVPLFAEERYHMPQLEAATLLTARAIGSILVAGATSFLLRRIGYRLPILVGFGLAIIGLFLLSHRPIGLDDYAFLALGAAVMGIGNGISAPATNNATLALAPTDVASIAGLRSMFRQLGGILAISTATAIAARSSNEGAALGHLFFLFAFVLIAILPLILLIPERRASW